MPAPRVAAPLNPPIVEHLAGPTWMRLLARGCGHFATRRRYTTRDDKPVGAGWHAVCGWSAYEDERTGEIAVPAEETVARCGRCLRLLRQSVESLEPCSGCESSTCIDCNQPTEPRMLNWLQAHYAQSGLDRFTFSRHVRSECGPGARIADAVAMDLRSASGPTLHGFEVKISRSDWQQELRDPDKWRAVGKYMDRWWLAISDIDIVRGGELPTNWGLLLVTPSVVHVVRRAPELTPTPVDRSFLAALVRAASRSA